MSNLTFDGTHLSAFGVVVSGNRSFDAPERDVAVESIPGRNGDLIIDNGRYKNRRLIYPAFIYKNAAANAALLRSFLASRSAGYYRLTDTYDTAHFVMARYSGSIEFEMHNLNRSAHFNMAFDCKPQRFLAAYNSFQVTGVRTFSNPTGFPALPVFAFRMSPGSSTVDIGGRIFNIDSNLTGIMYLDFETQNAYKAETEISELGYRTTTGGDPIDVLTVSPEDANKFIAFINGRLSGKTMHHLHRDTGVRTSHIIGQASLLETSAGTMMSISRSYAPDQKYYLATNDKRLLAVGDATDVAATAYFEAIYSNPVEYTNCNSYVAGHDFSPITGDSYITYNDDLLTAYFSPRWWEL